MKRFAVFFAVFLLATIVFIDLQYPIPPPSPISIQPPNINPPPQPIQFTQEQARNAVNAENLKKYVYDLCAFDGRLTGSQGNQSAAQYLKSFFNENKIQVDYQPFTYQGRKSGNVIAWINGTSQKNEIVVIGAHYDHIGHGEIGARARGGICYGADDNASGTAAVLELARVFSKMPPPPRTLVFQCYSGEEFGLIGSKYYVDHPMFPKDAPDIRKHVFMVNLDMIGYYKGQNVMFEGSRGGASDHMSFYNRGVPCVFYHTGLHQYYHTPQDTPDKLNYQGMQTVTRLAFDTICQKAKGSVPGYQKYQTVIFTHDHDHPEVPFSQN